MNYQTYENTGNKNKLNSLLAKLFAGIFIVICLAVGIVGLILPIIPGLLFLAIAAMIVGSEKTE
jgi:hypothetical protein